MGKFEENLLKTNRRALMTVKAGYSTPVLHVAEIEKSIHLTIECGGVLHTTDRDFARLPGLRWTNPLT